MKTVMMEACEERRRRCRGAGQVKMAAFSGNGVAACGRWRRSATSVACMGAGEEASAVGVAAPQGRHRLHGFDPPPTVVFAKNCE